MSMDKLESVPIDTHMIQIAERDYKLKIPTKSLTEKSYNIIGDHFRTVFGYEYAGWAHSVLFAADLGSLKVKGDVKVKQDAYMKLEIMAEKLVKTEVVLIVQDDIKVKNEVAVKTDHVTVKEESFKDTPETLQPGKLSFKTIKRRKIISLKPEGCTASQTDLFAEDVKTE
jgi:N-glycosylase/DNA lyase